MINSWQTDGRINRATNRLCKAHTGSQLAHLPVSGSGILSLQAYVRVRVQVQVQVYAR